MPSRDAVDEARANAGAADQTKLRDQVQEDIEQLMGLLSNLELG